MKNNFFSLKAAIATFLTFFFLLSGATVPSSLAAQASKLLPVEGSLKGSVPTALVENRRLWEQLPADVELEYSTLTAKKINLPRFLLDSEDAAAANAELDEIAAKLSADFIEATENEYYNDVHANFSIYQDEEILSVMTRHFSVSTMIDEEYQVFNFRLSDGKRLSDSELAEMLGFGDKVLGLMENAISRNFEGHDYYNGTAMEVVYGANQPRYWQGFALKTLWEKYSPDGSRLYLDPTGQVMTYYNAGPSPYTVPCKVDLLMNYKDKELNPIYVKMARELGLDPFDESYDALLAFVGASFDEASSTSMLARLFSWQEDYLGYNLPTVLIRANWDENSGKFSLFGYENYLLVPRMKHAVISMQALEMSEQGELYPIEDMQLSLRSAVGAALMVQNVSDLFPNAEITIQYRDQEIKFSPYMSLKDGSLVSHDRIYDAGPILGELPSPEEAEKLPIAYEMLEVLLEMMGIEPSSPSYETEAIPLD